MAGCWHRGRNSPPVHSEALRKHMPTIRLAYRDHDRTPVIFCIKAMAEKHYGVNVEVLHIHEKHAFERALLDSRCDTIIEHIEYLYAEAAKGLGVTFFCAPQIHRGLQLVVPADFTSVEQLRGKRMAVRDLGRPFAVTLWLRKMGLERDVETVIVADKDIGRWQQWRKVVSGECAACFVAPIYLPPALAAGLKVFPVDEAEIVSNFAQACLSRFAADNPALMKNYMKAVIHALALLLYRREEAVNISAGEPMRLMKVADRAELGRQVDSIAEMLRVKPYPTAEAIVNTNAIAAHEYGARIDNPITLWDLHWVKELDDEGFIDRLVASLSTTE
jgi:ABC-type nitrate/sulfonate/bicarbonate transport system substrate-binding protein